MKNLALTTCFFFLSIQLINAQSRSVVWDKCFGGTAKDIARHIVLNPDGTMVVAGYSHSVNGDVTGHHGDTTTADGWVIKLDTAGNLLWQKSVGGTADDFLNTVIATDDGGYLCTGYTYSNDGDVSGNHGMADVWAVKLNDNGLLQWSKCYGGSQMDTAVDAVRLYDGQFALTGATRSNDGHVLSGPANNTAYDAWVIKVNKTNGSLLWERVINYGDSLINDGGMNIAESNTHHITAYVNAGRIINSNLVYTNFVYVLNETTGSASLLSSTGGSGRSQTMMYKSNTGNNFIYESIGYFGSPANCYSYTRTMERQDFLGNVISITKGIKQDCTMQGEWAQPESQLSQPHGMIVSSSNKFISVGQAPEEPRFIYSPIRAYISNIGVLGGSYSEYSLAKDKVNAIQELSIGDEFIAAGQTGSGGITQYEPNAVDFKGSYDFWVIKYQSLNTIKSNFYIDYNNNNVKDAGEPPFNRAVAKTFNAAGGESSWTYPKNGITETIVGLGTFKTSAALFGPYYSISPDTTTNTFTTYKNTVTLNYPVHPIPGSRDYVIYITPATAIRPGFNVNYGITYRNVAIDTLVNKQVRFVKDSRLQFISSVPAPATIVGDTITWNIGRLLPGSGGSISVNFQAALLPALQLGDTVTAVAYIDSTGDLTRYNNVSTSVQTVTGSFDPNDKQENLGGYLQLSDAASGQYLTYTIRFQNTGNDTAFNIVVRDTLSALLDSNSFEMIHASHDYKVSISNGRYVAWKFNDIKLPDSTNNEPLSHGYISYRIQPKLPVGIGDVIQNRAAIYFDYNPPIITNTNTTEIKGTPSVTSWTGAVSTAWENALNWSNGMVPDVNTIVTVPAAAPRYPEINSQAACYRVSVMPGATVLVKTGFKLKVNAKN